MDYYPIVRSVLDAIDAAQVTYMIVGALSANIHGVMRATNDADIVVELADRRVSEITRHLGPEFVLDPQIAFDSVTGSYRHILTLRNSHFKVELFRLSKDAHDLERFERRKTQFNGPLGRLASYPTAEDVIIMKLRWAECLNRNKDKEDVRDIIAIQQESLDWSYIEGWVGKHGTQKLLNEIRATIPRQ
ncbi:hypothetical protein [Anatilimnocola floriformis]|uniref:hypothetical protein n=1 Tax=Anatilimnocola floriformis TaxID=2948575 RepID=UPI0020C3C133|nr:hypothetical protein [Anatilimnocola floriformis]